MLNVIALYSEWIEIGRCLIPPDRLHMLEEIRDAYPPPDHKAHMVELWERTDPDGLSWSKFQEALKQMIEAKQQRTASVTSADPSSPAACLSPTLPSTFELSTVEENIKKLETRFSTLLRSVVKQLESEDKKTDEIHLTLLLELPQPLQVLYSESLDKLSNQLEKAESHRYFFSKLNSCWNFIDFDLLECIIKKHGDHGLNSKMKEYLVDLKEFFGITTVRQLVEYWEPLEKEKTEIPNDYRECMMKLECKAETCTIQKLDDIRKSFKYRLSATRRSIAAMYLAELTEECVIVVWIVSKEIVSELSNGITQLIASNPEFIQEYEISYLLLDDLFLYYPHDNEKKVNIANNNHNAYNFFMNDFFSIGMLAEKEISKL